MTERHDGGGEKRRHLTLVSGGKAKNHLTLVDGDKKHSAQDRDGEARNRSNESERRQAERPEQQPDSTEGAGESERRASAPALTEYEDREHGREFTDEELAELFKAADEEGEPPPPFFRSSRFRKIMAGVLALMLCAQVLAVLPQMFSLAAVRFLATSARLSQSEVVQEYKQSVVVIRSGASKGTGFVVSEDGLIVTNRHVVDGGAPSVHFADGRVFRGTIRSVDDDVDLAVVDIDADGLPSLTLAEAYDGAEDVPVYVIGNPLFFNGIANEGVTWGLLSERSPPLMAIEAPIYKGNSGSPVLTKDGQVIGVVFATSTLERDGKKHRIGLAVPVDWVHRHLTEAD
ncbi:serine protease [Paenibacillus sp.]|uniref:S1C family serine protease n=1 Tax=Paenibacillus sp. TaxID=58172 RepID=UPI002D27A726|nr:serine protease [Paenibacillus sp.]HZG87102.1 serine protease [Paenibacillus sp.]